MIIIRYVGRINLVTSSITSQSAMRARIVKNVDSASNGLTLKLLSKPKNINTFDDSDEKKPYQDLLRSSYDFII